MQKRTKLAVGAGAALAVVGARGARAAHPQTPKEENHGVGADAAKQLGVDPAKLTDALQKALENRIDEAVKAGWLTEAQGRTMKQRIESGDFPLFGGAGFAGPRGFAHRGFRDIDSAAAYLGISEDALRLRLRDGDTLAEVAKEKGKSVDGLVSAIVAGTAKRLDQAVAGGRITKAQRDEIVAGLKERTTAIVNGDFPALKGRGGPGFGRDFGPPGFGPGYGGPRELEPDDAA